MSDKDKQPSLFDRLGGKPAIQATITGFYERILADEKLAFFFEGIDMPILRLHQLRFFNIAFTEVPEDLDVAALIMEKHMRLFDEKGLNESHFDIVAGHLVATLVSLNVPQDLIDEAVGVVAPLRVVFEKGAKKYGGGPKPSEKTKKERDASPSPDGAKPSKKTKITDADGTVKAVMQQLGGTVAVDAIVQDVYDRITADEILSPLLADLDPQVAKSQLLQFLNFALSKEHVDSEVPEKLFWEHLESQNFDRFLGHSSDSLREARASRSLTN